MVLKRDCTALLAGLTLAACAGAAQASDLGPFRIGMTFEEARAAAPKARWAETRSDYTQKVIELEGRNAFKLDGLAFHVTLKPLAYGAYDLAAVYSVERGARRAGCEAAVHVVAKALEPRFGRLGPLTPLSAEERGGLPLGFDLLSMFEQLEPVTVGQGSRVEVFQAADTDNTRWLTGRRDDGLTILVGGRYIDRDTPMWPTSCVVAAHIISMPPRPATDWVDVATLRSRPEPTRGARWRSFRGQAALPAAPADVEVTCEVHRRTARLSACRAPDGVTEALGKPAAYQANGLRLDAATLDPDTDVPLHVKLTVRVDPADAATPAPPPGQVALKPTDVVWTARPSAEDFTRSYPDRAQRMELAARITMLCRIGSGGELTCPSTTIQTVEGEEGSFDTWPERMEPLYRAGPTLIDGSPSNGRWVTLVFNLTPS